MHANDEPPAKGQAVRRLPGDLITPGGNVRAIIIAGGQPAEGGDWQRWVRDRDLIVGADGGAAQALAWGLRPDWVIGDMDSLPAEARATLKARGCRFIEHPRAKDETDLELALTYAVDQGADEIVILGALGGRLDHTLANVLLLTLPALEGALVRIVDGRQEALLARSGRAVAIAGQPGDLVSLLPLGGDARGVTTSGLAWALQGETLRFGFSRGVSNEMTAPAARVEIGQGHLLVIHGPSQEKEGVSKKE
jgi:thiamine pyrophosphokinase